MSQIPLTRRQTLGALAALYAGSRPAAADPTTEGDPETEPALNRLATTVDGAEITGMFLTERGEFFFNVQHPEGPNANGYNRAVVGALEGADLRELPRDFESVQPPSGELDEVKTAVGSYRPLAHGADPTDDGGLLGVPPAAPTDLEESPLPGAGAPTGPAYTPDFNGFIQHPEKPEEGFLFTNWEFVPGLISRLHLRRAGDRSWEVVGTKNLDFEAVEGTWTNCFGTVTPWKTPLSSEEYEPDAGGWYSRDNYQAALMGAYLGYWGNPYRYGYILEVADPVEDPTPVKRFALGRFAHENAVVMPDERTVYMSDDGDDTVFFKFVADAAGDLSSGTLYAAKATHPRRTQGADVAEVGFDIEWLELAHAADEEVASWVAEYDGQSPEDSDPDYVTDEEVRRWANGDADDDRAAFLESRKAAEAVGATAEFNKMEGVNIRRGAEPGDYLYMAMSNVSDGMADGEGDVQTGGNEYGALYRMELESGYDVSRMAPVVTGGPNANICGGCPYDAQPNSNATACANCAHNPENEEAEGVLGTASLAANSGTVDPENAIANPDNVVVMPDGRVVIGEDTTRHEHNMIWVYAPEEA
jgi:secreted PhoX family phosphatase